MIANETQATSTDTIHRVRTRAGVDPRALAAASINTLTFAFAEVVGRSYGGGVLELEPREAEELPFPDPTSLSRMDITRIEDLTYAGRLIEALDYVDRVLLVESLALDPGLVAELHQVWMRLRDRRLSRGRRTPARAIDATALAA